MISVDLARALRAAGLHWTPAPGDRFVLPDRDMDADVFVISDMAIDVHEFATGTVIGFNGTTEWALDSIEEHAAVWLPRETQLRELLAGRFVSLEQSPGGFVVTVEQDGGRTAYVDADVERAYARALLATMP
jgi:hypothetical protein